MQEREYEPFTLRFATFLSPILQDAYEFIASYIGEQIGCSSRLVTGTSLEEFAGGEVHLGFVCGLLYAQRAQFPSCPVELLAAPVLLPPRYRRKPIYFSDVIVRRDSPFASFDDLEGCAWGYNERGSHSGWNLVRYALYKQGCGAHFFGSALETGSHLRSIEMVMLRKVDAAAIDSHVLDIFNSCNPDLAAQLRVVALLGPSAIPPLVVSKQLDASLKRDIRQVLLNMHRDQRAARMLRQSLIGRFVAVTEEHYHRIYRMFSFVQQREMASSVTAR
jgi:phosphonate transport system substrate-binding protein